MAQDIVRYDYMQLLWGSQEIPYYIKAFVNPEIEIFP